MMHVIELPLEVGDANMHPRQEKASHLWEDYLADMGEFLREQGMRLACVRVYGAAFFHMLADLPIDGILFQVGNHDHTHLAKRTPEAFSLLQGINAKFHRIRR